MNAELDNDDKSIIFGSTFIVTHDVVQKLCDNVDRDVDLYASMETHKEIRLASKHVTLCLHIELSFSDLLAMNHNFCSSRNFFSLNLTGNCCKIISR